MTLKCDFDMGADTLYSVQWYKDNLEFFRFFPNQKPKVQIFEQQGITVNVSVSQNSIQIQIAKSEN